VAEVANGLSAASFERADEARLNALRARHELAAARARRAQRPRRGLVSVAPLHLVRTRHRFWNHPGMPADVLMAAEEARAHSVALQNDARVLRDSVDWQLRRLQRTRRLNALHWMDGARGLEEIEP
jgi:hypothetical protein